MRNLKKKDMKSLIITIALFVSQQLVCQELKYDSLSVSEKGEYTSYVGSDGGIYKVGDKLRIGVPSSNKTFAFIFQGDGIITPFEPVSSNASGDETEIKRIFLGGNKRTGLNVSMRTKGAIGLLNYTIKFENALATGEIKGYGLTSDEALSELKKAKDKLDLGLITQDEFNAIKLRLAAFIK